MKYTKKIGIIFTVVFLAAVFSTCDNIVSLGEKLNLSGPELTVDKPGSREAVDGIFVISGTVKTFSNVALDNMTITASYSEEIPGSDPLKFRNVAFPMEWRYTGSRWEVSVNNGPWTAVSTTTLTNGTTADAAWNGSNKNASWAVPINMMLLGTGNPLFELTAAEYQFKVTATDATGNSDDRSSITRTVIVDTDPPLVEIISPWPYGKYDFANPLSELVELDSMAERVPPVTGKLTYQNSQYLGKFLNASFDLQWYITKTKELSDIWAIELSFYDPAKDWDGTEEDDFIYRTKINDVRNSPTTPNPNSVLPNYTFTVPDLSVDWSGEGERTVSGGRREQLKTPITGKKTILVVVRCKDMANNELQEKELGYYIYWPESDVPWVSFADAVADEIADIYNSVSSAYNLAGRAYDDDGVESVEYRLYSVDANTGDKTLLEEFINGYRQADINPGNTIVSWEFSPPSSSGLFFVEARVYDTNPGTSKQVATYSGYFKVQDANAPKLSPPYSPFASSPLFEFIKVPSTNWAPENWYIDIEGYVTHPIGIKSVSMVWINPHSVNYAAMSQLAYFRDPDYAGWLLAPASPGTPPALPTDPAPWGTPPVPDSTYDTTGLHPNKVWAMHVDLQPEKDPESGRLLYKYHRRLSLKDDLNIDPIHLDRDAWDYLKSQVFLFKATDIDAELPKYDIISWAPQGDAESPRVKIVNVQIIPDGAAPGTEINLEPGKYRDPIAQFGGGDKIIITGTWEEDSVAFLRSDETFKKNFAVSINGKYTDDTKFFTLSIDPVSGGTVAQNALGKVTGNWTATGTVYALGSVDGVVNPDPGTHVLVAENLKDTLAVNVVANDVGGNISEDGASWLIESDKLRFLRLGSLTPDGLYSNGTTQDPVTIDVFLEFNKPVVLKPGRSPALPVLSLNTNGTPAGTAVYNLTHEDHLKNPGGVSTRQHFTYTVQAGQSVKTLTVSGLASGDTNFDQDAYPYTWIAGTGSDEIRMVTSNKSPSALLTNGEIVAKMPVTESPSDDEYIFTFGAGKQIEIDTVPPTLSAVVPNIKKTWYSYGNYLYITLTFNKDVKYGATEPKLELNIEHKNSSGVVTRTTSETDDVLISGNSLIFSYAIDTGDYTSSYGDLKITGLTGGTITDLAGNTYNSAGLAAASVSPLAGIRVDAIDPEPPTVEIKDLTGSVYNIITGAGNVTGNTSTGIAPWSPELYATPQDFDASSVTKIPLQNIYNENLYIEIRPSGTAVEDHERIRYSINYGRDWADYDYTSPNNPKLQTTPGYYYVTACQIDAAGNSSTWTTPITMYWDKGGLLTRISSSSPNGIFSGGRGDVIPITLTFRNPIKFTAAPSITLSAERETAPTVYENVTLTAAPADWSTTAEVTSFTYLYTIGISDTTNNEALAVDAINIKATDLKNIDISDLITLELVNTSMTNIQHLKNIVIQAGIPERVGDVRLFEDDTRTGYNNESSVNFQGIRTDDDSYWITLGIDFNRPISRGATMLDPDDNPVTPEVPNVVRVTQVPAGYRLPAVLTPIQRSRLMPAVDAKMGAGTFDSYYDVGTSGYDATNGSDTSTKYILKFIYDTYNIAPNASGSVDQQFAEALRQAEGVEISINSSLIEIAGNTLLVRLTGSNALKVPGANYEISYLKGLVVDSLGSRCDGYTVTKALGGVSTPAIRIQKTQDTITTATASSTQPRLVATQPGKASVRMDSRTPSSRVSYITGATTPGDIAVTWQNNFNNNPPLLNVPTGNPTLTGSPTSGTVYGSTTTAAVAALEIGPDADTTSGLYQGYKWRIQAAGMVGTTAPYTYSSKFAEEIAFRSVIVFVGSSVSGASGQTFGDGDQLWIRGGNTNTATTIPGYPITPSDNWTDLSVNKKRAGIRLFSKVSGTALASSTWQWVTWDMNATAYFSLYLGHDETSSAAQAFQYGPLYAAVHVGNWSNLGEYYCAFPGERRWLSNNTPDYYSSGSNRAPPYSFNATFDERPVLATTMP